jgi:short-subunit dehydrogenase
MPLAVDGATVLVTGASSGIGAALAPMLAERGATVGLLARRADRLGEVLERCRAHAPASQVFVADLADVAAAEAAVLEAWDQMGGLDVLVHNAAIPKRRRAQELTADEVDEVMRVNFTAPAHMTLAVLPRMLERDRGVIVNVASVGGRLGILHEAAYCASKFALCGWSESLALDLWHTGLDVRLIIPGPIDTEIWDLPDNDDPIYDGPLEPPGDVAAGIIAAIEGEGFEHHLPDLKSIVEFKTSDIDTFLAGTVEAFAPRQAPEGGDPS